jgi:hypothetical protein
MMVARAETQHASTIWRMIMVGESGMAGGCYPNCAKRELRKVEDHGMVKQDPHSSRVPSSCLLHD